MMTGRKILVVEDDPEMKSLLRDFLSRQGYGVLTASSGAGALHLILGGAYRPDIVVSDVRMTPMSGLELTMKLATERPELPVVLMSAFGEGELEREAIASGAKRYMKKPFALSQMGSAVQDILAMTDRSRARKPE